MFNNKTPIDHIRENHHRFHFFLVLIIATAISYGFLRISHTSVITLAQTPGYYFDTASDEFVLTDKTAMDASAGKGLWLGNKKLKVYRNVHGSDWIPADYGFEGKYSGFTLNPAKPIMPNFTGGGIVYINDGTTHWSNNPYQVPVAENNFEFRAGLGYVKNNFLYRNIDLNVTYFVPSYDINDPVAIQLVSVKNTSSQQKNIKLFTYYDVLQDGNVTFGLDGKSVFLSGGGGYPGLFMTGTDLMAGFDTNKNSFFGGGTEPNPAGVVAGGLFDSNTGSDDILALQADISLSPGGEKVFAFVFGTYDSIAERDRLASKYSDIASVNSALNSTKNFYKLKTDNIPGLAQRTPQLRTQLRLLGFSALSSSLWWDNFINKFALNQMSQYQADVNARDAAQIALGLMYMDPALSRDGLESYMHSQQQFSGYIPYGYNSYISRAGGWTNPANAWGSDNIAWIAYSSCEYVKQTDDTAWLTKLVPYYDSNISEGILTHLIKGLNYEYFSQIDIRGLLLNRNGDWLDHAAGSRLATGSSLYSSALLLAATKSCLPYMGSSDQSLYAERAVNLKNSIENSGFDATSGRYARWITTDGFKIGSSQDNRVFSDLAVTAFTGDLNALRVRNTVLAAYNTNQISGNKGNLVYTPSYPAADLGGLGGYTIPNMWYDNKIWGRVCSVVTAGLKRIGLNLEAENNFISCLPSSWGGGYSSPFNYIEYLDPRGNVKMCDNNAVPCGSAKNVSRESFPNAVDDSMAIWAQAQLTLLGIPPPNLIPINPNISCASGPYTVSMSWTGQPSSDPAYDFFIDLDNDSDWNNGFWNKAESNNSTSAPSGFTPYLGALGALRLNPGTTYRVRVFNGATDLSGNQLHSNTVTFSVPACGALPVINSFTASPSTITVGNTVILSWNVTSATTISISGIGVVTGTSTTVSPTTTTTYTLTATNSAGSVTRQVPVTVNPPSQTLQPPSLNLVNPGISCASGPYTVTLSWSGSPYPGPEFDFFVDIDNDNNWGNGFWNKMESANSTSIPSGFGPYNGAIGNLTLNPNTTYYVRVFNGATDFAGNQLHSNTVTFSVPACGALPVINSFTASSLIITAGQSSTLSWNVTGATTISISGIGNVTGNSRTISPSSTTAYTLTATNSAGSVTSEIVVTVNQVPPPPTPDTTSPIIISWDIQPRIITTGSNVTISWNATDSGGSFLNRAEFFITSYDVLNCNAFDKSGCFWSPIKTVYSPSVNNWSSTTTFLTSIGHYYFGMHIVDGAGNWDVEPTPIEVIVNSVPPTPTPIPVSTPISTPTPTSTPTSTPTPTPTPTPIISISPPPTPPPTFSPVPQSLNPLETFDLWMVPKMLSGFSCYAIRFALIIFAIMIVGTGIMFLLSRGNAQRLAGSKKAFLYALVGGLLSYGVYTIIYSILAFLGYAEFSWIPVCT